MDPRPPLRERRIIVSILDAIKKKPRGLPVIPWLVVPLLGLFILVYPIRVLFASDLSAARTAFALGGAALFTGVFLWLMWTREPLRLVPAEPSEVLKVRLAVAFLAVLAGLLGFGAGPEWRMLFFYHLNVAAGIMLPKRDAYAVVAGIVLLTLVAGASTGFWWLAAPAIAIGLWSIAFVGQVAAVAQLKAAREELARLAVSEERLRFARDLHDLLGHSLSLITLKSELAERLLPETPENRKAIEEVRGLQGVARGALKEVREAVSGYRRPSLDEELAGACAMLEAAGISCRARKEVESLPGDTEGILTWVVREGATNVVRHSRAKRCEIRLTRNGDRVRAEVRDNGPGTRLKRAADGVGGSGLAGLAERVRASGGQFEAGPLPDGGFGLRVMLPLGENDSAGSGGWSSSEASVSEGAK
jgi:two-component system, NarL family, sensor histidine kinase DesK